MVERLDPLKNECIWCHPQSSPERKALVKEAGERGVSDGICPDHYLKLMSQAKHQPWEKICSGCIKLGIICQQYQGMEGRLLMVLKEEGTHLMDRGIDECSLKGKNEK